MLGAKAPREPRMWPWIVVVVILLVAGGLLACDNCTPSQKAGMEHRVHFYPQRFHEGDVVTMKVDGRKGIVLWANCSTTGQDIHHACEYKVRFQMDTYRQSDPAYVVTAPPKEMQFPGSNTGFAIPLGGGSEHSAYGEQLVYDYELDPA